jgi:hypothetical protein
MVEPGILGRQIFYLTDGEAGIQIFKSDANFSDLTIGDYLKLTGTISSNRGEPRIKIGKNDELEILGGKEIIVPLEIEIIKAADAGQLVQITGIITEKSSQRLTIENQSGQSEIRIKEGTEIKLVDFKPGDKITAVGIIGQSEEKFFLLPRTMDDLAQEKTEIAETAAAIAESPPATGKQIAEQADENKALWIGLTVIATLIGRTLYERLRRQNKPYDKKREFSFAPAG